MTVDNQKANEFVHYKDYSNNKLYRDVGKLQVYEFAGTKYKVESYSVGFFESFLGGDIRNSGVAFTWQDGQGKENRKAFDYDMVEIDEIMSAFDASKAASDMEFVKGKYLQEKLGKMVNDLLEDFDEIIKSSDFLSDSYSIGKSLHEANYEKPINIDNWIDKGFSPDIEPKLNKKGVDTILLPGKRTYNNGKVDSIVPTTGKYRREFKNYGNGRSEGSIKPLQKENVRN